ncbi:hypothetical protein [Sorangium cellulosum]|uniref:hypothetical protein n=1 Tax=Sorangium cellulosum TaxID=56 RepID=UPI001F5CDA69|nr:hypothetical protein [Sorangium cellulosum]
MTEAPERGPRRRGVVFGLLSCALGLALPACGGAPPPAARPSPPLPPLDTADLTRLLPQAGLRWLVLARPREIAAVPWLIPWIALVAPEENLARHARATGIDLRQVREAAIASYAGRAGDVTFHVARHSGEPRTIERLFRRRLTGRERRAVDRPDLVRLSGDIGKAPHTLVLLGRDVVGVQDGGSPGRGPARIASLYALGRLRRSPTALSGGPLAALAARFGPAPLRAFAPGPFEGELARGARGLLAAATAVGAAARPSAREGIALAIAVAGDFSTSGEAASEELLAAWDELAHGSFGHLLGLDAPVEPPLATHAPDAVAIAVELDPRALARGLAAATGERLQDMLR